MSSYHGHDIGHVVWQMADKEVHCQINYQVVKFLAINNFPFEESLFCGSSSFANSTLKKKDIFFKTPLEIFSPSQPFFVMSLNPPPKETAAHIQTTFLSHCTFPIDQTDRKRLDS